IAVIQSAGSPPAPVLSALMAVFFFQAEDGIRDFHVTGVQTCALPIFISCIKGIMIVWKGINIVAMNVMKMIRLNLLSVLASIQAVIDANITTKMMETTVI